MTYPKDMKHSKKLANNSTIDSKDLIIYILLLIPPILHFLIHNILAVVHSCNLNQTPNMTMYLKCLIVIGKKNYILTK